MTREAASIEDLRRIAARHLPRAIFDTIEGGAGSEQSLRANRHALEKLALVPRVLRDVTDIDARCDLLGRESALPLILGPTGMNGFYRREGELAVAAAAERQGVIYVASAVASVELERVVGPNRRTWFQLYPLERRDISADLIRRAKEAGCEALVVTVDMPRIGVRLRDLRNGVSLPPRPDLRLMLHLIRHLRWALPYATGYRPQLANLAPYRLDYEDDLRKMALPKFDTAMSWDGIADIARQWGGPLIVKGVLSEEDIRAAADSGASGVILSNHGGRQLDCAPATTDVLASLDPAKLPIDLYIDGGVRSGSDIAKLVALGAKACLIGRAYLYGLCADGEEGVERAIMILSRELHDAMALSGRTRLDQLDRSALSGLD